MKRLSCWFYTLMLVSFVSPAPKWAADRRAGSKLKSKSILSHALERSRLMIQSGALAASVFCKETLAVQRCSSIRLPCRKPCCSSGCITSVVTNTVCPHSISGLHHRGIDSVCPTNSFSHGRTLRIPRYHLQMSSPTMVASNHQDQRPTFAIFTLTF